MRVGYVAWCVMWAVVSVVALGLSIQIGEIYLTQGIAFNEILTFDAPFQAASVQRYLQSSNLEIPRAIFVALTLGLLLVSADLVWRWPLVLALMVVLALFTAICIVLNDMAVSQLNVLGAISDANPARLFQPDPTLSTSAALIVAQSDALAFTAIWPIVMSMCALLIALYMLLCAWLVPADVQARLRVLSLRVRWLSWR